MNLTETIKKTLELDIVPEVTNPKWSMFDDGSAEVEVLEFLYSFIRMIKPENVLETGTYKGLSSSYIGSALKENNFGHLTTLEIEQQHIVTAKAKWAKLGLLDWITEINQSSLEFTPQSEYDFMFLDSEPYYRFKELARYFDKLKPGGHVFIHDMPANLCQGNVNPDHPEFINWPVGEIPSSIFEWYRAGSLVMTHCNTPRGLAYFYKKTKEEAL